jgi:hypothetical protein
LPAVYVSSVPSRSGGCSDSPFSSATGPIFKPVPTHKLSEQPTASAVASCQYRCAIGQRDESPRVLPDHLSKNGPRSFNSAMIDGRLPALCLLSVPEVRRHAWLATLAKRTTGCLCVFRTRLISQDGAASCNSAFTSLGRRGIAPTRLDGKRLHPECRHSSWIGRIRRRSPVRDRTVLASEGREGVFDNAHSRGLEGRQRGIGFVH